MFYLILCSIVNLAYTPLQVITDPLSPPIKQLHVRYHIEFFIEDETLFTNDNCFTIYYYQDLTLYKFRHHYKSSVNGKLSKEGYQNSYFVFGKGDQDGYRFDPNRPESNGSASVDSILGNYALGNFVWDQIIAFTPLSSYDTATGVLEEIYGPSSEQDKDTMKFYYSNRYTDYEFSLSKKLDSLKKMKLFKIVVQNAPFYYEKLKKEFPKRESYFMMEEGKQTDLEQIRHYFNQYKKMKRGPE